MSDVIKFKLYCVNYFRYDNKVLVELSESTAVAIGSCQSDVLQQSHQTKAFFKQRDGDGREQQQQQQQQQQ